MQQKDWNNLMKVLIWFHLQNNSDINGQMCSSGVLRTRIIPIKNSKMGISMSAPTAYIYYWKIDKCGIRRRHKGDRICQWGLRNKKETKRNLKIKVQQKIWGRLTRWILWGMSIGLEALEKELDLSRWWEMCSKWGLWSLKTKTTKDYEAKRPSMTNWEQCFECEEVK